jgi:hypothetical protein
MSVENLIFCTLLSPLSTLISSMKQASTKRRPALKTPRIDLKGRLQLMGRDVLSVILLVAATIVLIALVVWFNSNYNTFPDLMPLHFDAQGNPDRIGERSELRGLLVIAAVVYTLNILSGLGLRLFARMTFAPYLLWSGALLVELLLWVALWNVTR